MERFRVFIFTISVALVMVMIFKYLLAIQKSNNYMRCASVINMAKKIGKLSIDLDTHKQCKYHLEKKYLGFL